MKYLKLFEEKPDQFFHYVYYEIEVKKSINILNIALDKLKLKELFYKRNQNQILNAVNFYNVIYLIIQTIGKEVLFGIETDPNDVKRIYKDDIHYGGEIKIEDFEVDANKYNL